MRKLIAKLAAKYSRLTSCYEAGPTGYGLYRLIKSLSHECIGAAPSLIPKKPGDRVKTNRRDAVSLTKLWRAGELTAVWVPDERHEAMRDLSRARSGGEEGSTWQAPADLVADAAAGALLSGQDDVGTGPHEVADVAKARVSNV
jgi:transposase